MIEPSVFPFTCLDAKTAGMLLSCFDHIRVYLPTDSAGDEFDPEVLKSGLINARNPLPDSGLQVDQLFREYRQWREANRGTDISFFKMSGSDLPFFNDTTISFLRQDILRAVAGASEDTVDLLLTARVFLRMTGNYDRAQAEIADALSLQSEKEFSMLAALQGDDDGDDEEAIVPATGSLFDDAGELMTLERLTAWSMLAAEDNPLPALFVTPSRAVLTAVMDCFENNREVWENIPVPGDWQDRDQPDCEQWRNDLAGFLAGLLKGDTPGRGRGLPPGGPAGKAGAYLTIIHLTDVSPGYFLEKFHHKAPGRRRTMEDNASASTLVMAVIPA